MSTTSYQHAELENLTSLEHLVLFHSKGFLFLIITKECSPLNIKKDNLDVAEKEKKIYEKMYSARGDSNESQSGYHCWTLSHSLFARGRERESGVKNAGNARNHISPFMHATNMSCISNWLGMALLGSYIHTHTWGARSGRSSSITDYCCIPTNRTRIQYNGCVVAVAHIVFLSCSPCANVKRWLID